MTPAGLEPAIPGSLGRCLIHWATGPCDGTWQGCHNDIYAGGLNLLEQSGPCPLAPRSPMLCAAFACQRLPATQHQRLPNRRGEKKEGAGRFELPTFWSAARCATIAPYPRLTAIEVVTSAQPSLANDCPPLSTNACQTGGEKKK